MFFDLNGREATAIKGAIATIKRFAPVIITTLPAEATSDIIDALQALDYRLVDKVGGDYVYMQGGADMKDGMPRELVTSRKRG